MLYSKLEGVKACCRVLLCVLPAILAQHLSYAQEVKVQYPIEESLYPRFGDTEDKYLFGFTTGTDIGEKGERELALQTNGVFQKRSGSFSVIEQVIEYESVPTDSLMLEVAAHGQWASINNVPGLNNQNSVGFNGLSTKLTYRILERGPESSIGLSVSAEPQWLHIDGSSGTNTNSYDSTFKLLLDTEFLPARLYGAINFLYDPQRSNLANSGTWQTSSTVGVTGGLTYRVTPALAVGGGLQYYQAYDGAGFGSRTGEALYVGPNVQYQIAPNALLIAAVSVQVAGHSTSDTAPLDLVTFNRYTGFLKLAYAF